MECILTHLCVSSASKYVRTVHPGAVMFAFHSTPATSQVSKWHSIAFFQLGSW